MENSSKALYMAGSLLIALLIVSLLVYSFRNLGRVQEEKDKIQDEESITAFNKEFEAYNKKVMYGTDLLSCVNKAINNNEMYVKGGSRAIFGAASKDEGTIEIEVIIHKTITESLSIYSYDGKRESYIFTPTETMKKDNYLITTTIYKLCGVKNEKNILSSKIDENTTLKGLINTGSDDIINKSPHTLSFDVITVDNSATGRTLNFEELKDLCKNANDLKYKGYNTNADKTLGTTWYSIEWVTALYNLKMAHFKCTDIKYNDNTGRITKMTFEQINK